jgi:putative hydrolase of the HAD superfamily
MKAVLFDLFGTLVDNATNAQLQVLHIKIATVLGVSPEEFENGWKTTFQIRSRGLYGSVKGSIIAAASKCSVPFDEAAVPQAVKIRYEFVRDWLTPRPDALETILQLRNQGYRIGLLSNCTEDVPDIWPSLAFSEVIDEPLFSCLEGLRKPMPEFYHRALGRLNVAASDCLYVADGDNGELAAAKKLGMPVVMIRPSDLLNDYRQDPEEDWDGPRIERLSELLHLGILK